MSSHQKKTTMTHISVNFIGNKPPISWEPEIDAQIASGGQSQATESSLSTLSTMPTPSDFETTSTSGDELSDSDASLILDEGGKSYTLPVSDETLRARSIHLVEARLRVLRGEGESDDEYVEKATDNAEKTKRISKMKQLYALLGILHDPTSKCCLTDWSRFKIRRGRVLDDQDLADPGIFETYHGQVIDDLLTDIGKITEFWGNFRTEDPDSPTDTDIEVMSFDPGSGSKRTNMTPSAPEAKRRKPTPTMERAEPSKNPTSGEAFEQRREYVDEAAQRKGRGLYKNICILTGANLQVEGAHILDYRVKKKWNQTRDSRTEDPAHQVWLLLGNFWPLPNLAAKIVGELQIQGEEVGNILPLRVDAHRFWDAHRFALRPIRHPDDPEHRLYLQVLWLNDIVTKGSLLKGQWDHAKHGSIVDFRRGSTDEHPHLNHGDVFELITPNKDTHPLPKFSLLEMRFATQKLLAGMKAAGALRDMFREPPPDGFTGPVPSIALPFAWEMVLEAAVDEQIMDIDTADKWKRAVLEALYEKQQVLAREVAKWRARKLRNQFEEDGREG